MKVPANLDEAATRVSIKLRQSVNADIGLYSKMFEQEHGHKVGRDALIEHMLGQFMQEDKHFQRLKKQAAKQDKAAKDNTNSVESASRGVRQSSSGAFGDRGNRV